jgi:hypothetical protein
MRSGVPRQLVCFCVGVALFSGYATAEGLRNKYRGKEAHKAFLICQDGAALLRGVTERLRGQ